MVSEVDLGTDEDVVSDGDVLSLKDVIDGALVLGEAPVLDESLAVALTVVDRGVETLLEPVVALVNSEAPGVEVVADRTYVMEEDGVVSGKLELDEVSAAVLVASVEVNGDGKYDIEGLTVADEVLLVAVVDGTWVTIDDVDIVVLAAAWVVVTKSVDIVPIVELVLLGIKLDEIEADVINGVAM